MVDLDPVVESLARCRLFTGLGGHELTSLAAEMRSRRFRRGEVLFHQGDPGDALFVVTSGAVKIGLPSEEGDEAIIATVREGEFFGELALLDGLRDRPPRPPSSRPRRLSSPDLGSMSSYPPSRFSGMHCWQRSPPSCAGLRPTSRSSTFST